MSYILTSVFLFLPFILFPGFCCLFSPFLPIVLNLLQVLKPHFHLCKIKLLILIPKMVTIFPGDLINIIPIRPTLKS